MSFIQQAHNYEKLTQLRTIHSYHRGFIITGDDKDAQRSFVFIYESDQYDNQEPYKLIDGRH